MRRGPKRKPTALRVIEGNRSHRPIPEGEPEFSLPDDVPVPPDFLDAYGREEWDRIAPELYAAGLITVVDTGTLAAYCEAYATWRAAVVELQRQAKVNDKTLAGAALVKTKSGNVIQNPLRGVANTARAAMVRIAAEFGLTPSSRANLEGSKRGDEDPAEAKFFGSKR